MNREKVAGENFRDGSMEVAFELWIEQMNLMEMIPMERIPSRLQRRFPPLSGEAVSEAMSGIPASYRVQKFF